MKAPFEDQLANADYGTRLRQGIDAFLQVKLPISTPQVGLETTPSINVTSNTKTISVGAIVGIVVSVFIVLAIGTFSFYKKCYETKSKNSGNSIATPPIIGSDGEGNEFPNIDPAAMYQNTAQSVTESGDENTSLESDVESRTGKGNKSKINLTYSYAGNSVSSSNFDYGKVASKMGADQSSVESGGRSKGDMSYVDSDLHVEEDEIVIYAPAGKLGLVLDNPDDGPPVVHTIKENSILNGQIFAGDRLVAVDEMDVRDMTPMKVSKLISARSNRALRKLTLTRSRLEIDQDGLSVGSYGGMTSVGSQVDTDWDDDQSELKRMSEIGKFR